MNALHLSKVAVGCATLESLRKRIESRSKDGECKVITRMRPRRCDELVGGSLFWIIRHRLVARQQILRFDDRPDGRIAIVCSDELQMIDAIPKRAHQGWRYLEPAKLEETGAPGAADLPPRLYGKLAALALL